MADGKKKMFINKLTGEVIFRRTRWSAIRYFKADGKACGYEFRKSDVVDADGFLKVLAAAAIASAEEESEADGIA